MRCVRLRGPPRGRWPEWRCGGPLIGKGWPSGGAVEQSRDEELRAQGWTRQFLADEPRLSEAVDLYRSLGLEVHLEPLSPAEEGECRSCLEANLERFKVIYTRPTRGG